MKYRIIENIDSNDNSTFRVEYSRHSDWILHENIFETMEEAKKMIEKIKADPVLNYIWSVKQIIHKVE